MSGILNAFLSKQLCLNRAVLSQKCRPQCGSDYTQPVSLDRPLMKIDNELRSCLLFFGKHFVIKFRNYEAKGTELKYRNEYRITISVRERKPRISVPENEKKKNND